MIRFGSWSTTLGLAAAFGGLTMGLLLLSTANRVANRLLAALIGTAVLRLMPYVLGFAGFYDAYPWLSFAPFNFALAAGPLLYLYVRRLVTPRLPAHWRWHLLPAFTYFCYTLWAFALPLGEKNHWNDSYHATWIQPLESVASAVSLATYLVLTMRFRRRYVAWLVEHVSDRDLHRQPWLTTLLIALGLNLSITVVFEFVDRFVTPLTYYDRFPQYLGFSAIVLLLGLEGWRYADRRFPIMSTTIAAPLASLPIPPRDWSAIAATWRTRVQEEGWAREPGLTLAEVARRLGTNESYVSRAFNTGLGRNFNGLVNGIRIDAIQHRLAAGDDADLLTIAFEEGFSSKSSFNRLFRERTGMSPTAWRTSQIQKSASNPQFETTGGVQAI